MRQLRAAGFRFALDDFGAGISSFSYLKNLPMDYLKIDGAFVRDMATDPMAITVVAAINQIGHAMGIRTIAESVENAQVLDALRTLGVDYAQGYHISRPAPLFDTAAVQQSGKAAGS